MELNQSPVSSAQGGGSLRIVVWNLEWASRGSRRGEELARRIFAEAPHIVALTETDASFPGDTGYTLSSSPDYGYRAPSSRRKVVLWSRTPWRDVDAAGAAALPPGRFVKGSTETPLGWVEVWGICIPWRDAHVRTGRRDRVPWQDHVAYLRALRPPLAAPSQYPRIVVGDFNQTVPRTRAPETVYRDLEAALTGLSIATARTVGDDDRPSIDHVALEPGLKAVEVRPLSATNTALRLSDHFGLFVRIERQNQDQLAVHSGSSPA